MSATRFEETQAFRQWWLWLLLVPGVAVGWWFFVQQIVLGKPIGSEPAPDWAAWLTWGLCGVGLPLLMGSLRLVTRVDAAGLHVRFRPFLRRSIGFDEITSAASVAYRPIRQFGGWGLRYGFKNGWAYNVSGNRGVQLVLADGKKLLIGSQRPDELARALGADD